MSARFKITIIYCFGNAAVAKTRLLVDVESTMYLLKNSLKYLQYFSTQSVPNLQAKLNCFSFRKGDGREEQPALFLSTLDELAAEKSYFQM